MIHFKAKRVTITSALPYVNGVKHLGNIVGSMLPADVFHRFLDIMGIDNIFICGTDEHGTAVELAALEEGLSPAKYSEKYYKIQKDVYEKWNFDFSFFGRSSSPSNHRVTQDIFLSAHENGYIIENTLIIPFCDICKRFLPDRYIIGTCPHCGYERARGDQCERCTKMLDPEDLKDPGCSICGNTKIEFREEKHLFLNLPLLADKLEAWIKQHDHWPENTKNMALGWLREGLKPRCITRNLTWGVKVPLKGYENLVFYVWYDAPIAYISITKDGYEQGAIKENWKHYWKDSAIYHFIGKDNIPFHTIIWPAILLSARDSEQRDTNYLLPYFVQGYEYLNWEGDKFSTSQGRGLFSDEALDLFPADYWRFYLLSILPETKDSNFDWDDFAARINNELIANYGNLFYRVTYFVEKYFEGKAPAAELGDDEEKLFSRLKQTKEKVEELVGQVKLREALTEILALAGATNKYFQEKQPWAVVKKDKKAAGTTLFTAVNVLRALTVLLYPYIPSTTEKALRALNSGNKKFGELDKIQLTAGEPVKALILFKKIEKEELDKAKKYRTKYAKNEKEKNVILAISQQCKDLGINACMAIIKDARISNKNSELEKSKKSACEKAEALDIKNNKILEGYRKLYFKIGVHEKSSVESLVDFVKKNGKLPCINTVVDCYNLMSIETLLAAGAHDIKHIKGSPVIRILDGSEKYTPLGENEALKLPKGEYACADDEKVLCRLESRQCDETKITKETKEIMIYVQGNENTSDAYLQESMKKICDLITKICGGTYEIVSGAKTGKKDPNVNAENANKTKEIINDVNGMIPLKEFSKVEMRVGTVTAVRNHPAADKLYILDVDLGDETRQLVAALKFKYRPQELQGKQVIVVTNLEEKELRGVLSQGMLLAAEDGTILQPTERVENGSRIM
ncbi:MAG: methionine--tRNA ligase [Candidatus Aenigmarchaeota archaeon]|nr:methionine--tRNA ligase [Candidatus Aenigmarchaeota archaeon]